MMRKTSVILLSAATGAALTLFVTQPRAVLMGSSARAATSDTYRQLNLFGDVFERVRSDYVEKPDDSKLVESAISGMLAGLDPHSSYMDAKSFRDMQVQTRGEFGGLGIEVTMEDGLIKVVSPIQKRSCSSIDECDGRAMRDNLGSTRRRSHHLPLHVFDFPQTRNNG